MADQNICFKCATDLFLGGVIRRKGISTCCSLCAVKRKCFPIDQIVSRVEAILHDYICVPDLHRTVMKDGSVETTLGKRIEFWASHIFRTTEEAPIVAAVCANLKAFSNDRVTLERSFRVITSARNGAQGISGGKASDKPRIDYVADSLVAHPIRRVKYLDNEPDQDEG